MFRHEIYDEFVDDQNEGETINLKLVKANVDESKLKAAKQKRYGMYMTKEQKNRSKLEKKVIIMEKEPEIVRLQSKPCKLISDHEDVLGYDEREYPVNTEKISKIIALDVA